MDYYRIGSKVSDFYYVINAKTNRYQTWSRITNKVVDASKIPQDFVNLIEKQTIQDILLQALIQKQTLDKQILDLKKKIIKLNNDMTNLEHLYNVDNLATPKYFRIVNRAKKFIYNNEFEIISVKELTKLHIDPKSIQLAPLHIAKQFYTKKADALQEKLNRLKEKVRNLPNTQTNPECSLKEILEYQNFRQSRWEEFQKEPTFWDIQKKKLEEMKANSQYQFFGNLGQLFTRGDDLLKTFNISSKKDLHKWLLIYHPDRGGNTETCQKVMAAAKRAGFMH
jgi:hypothetical protein